jgi:pimeloyl-ACP methyl ester carboxylesterase
MLAFRRVVILAMIFSAGCVSENPVNPSFAVTAARARQVLDEAAEQPRQLQRALVVIGGFVDPGFASNALAMDFRACTGDARIIAVPLGYDTDFQDYRRRIIDAVQSAFPSSDPAVTTEVDVVGYSMGGLAARYAAEAPRPGEPLRRLRIARLFTISSPLSGAVVAERMPLLLEPLQQQMRPGSSFLNSVDTSQDPIDLYPVYSYVCLNDNEVGAACAAVPGQTAWWVSPPVLMSSHNWAFMDPRIRADIVRRLRGEPPLSTDPPAPLPGRG